MTQEQAAAPPTDSEELNRSEKEILDLIRARYSLMYIISSEEQRVEETADAVADRPQARPHRTYSGQQPAHPRCETACLDLGLLDFDGRRHRFIA